MSKRIAWINKAASPKGKLLSEGNLIIGTDQYLEYEYKSKEDMVDVIRIITQLRFDI